MLIVSYDSCGLRTKPFGELGAAAGGCCHPGSLPPSTVVIGTFDGVHLGHLALLRFARRKADELGTTTTVITFDRHPRAVVAAASRPPMLMTVEQKLEALAASKLVDNVLLMTFDRERSRQDPRQFVAEVIVRCARARRVVVGEDFRFGVARSGDIATLRLMGADLGFSVVVCPPVSAGPAHRYSSTLVRRLVAAGDLAGAERLLGRPFEVACEVVPPERRTTGSRRLFSLRARPYQCLPRSGTYVGELCDAVSGRSLSACRVRVLPAGRYRRVGLSVACEQPVSLLGDSARFRFCSAASPAVRADRFSA
ncbi:MAG: adenylyltransferase/cytidyltransferase family protein [Actinomycetota bacterium]|jgi:riboflavin kinase / FMN adenylyltransferase